MRHSLSVIAIFMVSAAMITCSGSERHKSDRGGSDVADSVFTTHLNRLSGIVEYSAGSDSAHAWWCLDDTLDESVSFLERVTGLASGRGGNYLGWVYTSRDSLANDIAKWEAWYRGNEWRLGWDSLSQDVVVDSSPQER